MDSFLQEFNKSKAEGAQNSMLNNESAAAGQQVDGHLWCLSRCGGPIELYKPDWEQNYKLPAKGLIHRTLGTRVVIKDGKIQSTTMTGTRSGNETDHITVIDMEKTPIQ